MNHSTLSAGVGKIDITPSIGCDMQGYTRDKGACGVFERLYSKAVVFGNDRTKTVLLANDLIGISPEIAAQVRKDIARKFPEVKPSNVMISATHTHCGPVMLPRVISRTGVDKAYQAKLRANMVAAVEQAMANLEPAKLGTGLGKAFFNVNRRLMTPKGLMFAPNRKGVCDHEVGVVRIDRLDGTPKAILVNFTCHPTTWGGEYISPDYPGIATKLVEAKYKNKVVALFTNGACGNIRPCLTKGRNPKDFGGGTRESVNRVGAELAREVARVAARIRTRPVPDTAAAARITRLPLGRPLTIPQLQKEVSDGKVKVREAIDQKQGPIMVLYEQERLTWAKKTLALMTKKQFKPWVPGEIQVLRVGGVTLVGLPGEILCEIGLAIKKALGPGRTFVVGYANDCIGYIPTAKTLKEGGYEPNDSIKGFNLPTRFSPRVETVMVNTAKALYRKIK